MALWRRRTTGKLPASETADRRRESESVQLADAIRTVLRRAGFREADAEHDGFSVALTGVEHGPAVVRFADGADTDVREAEARYHAALAAAGFRPVTGAIDKGSMLVFPAGVRPRVPRQSPREMANDWLRSLTITSEPGRTPEQYLELIARVNQPRTIAMHIRTPLPSDDAQALDESLAWLHDARSRQAGLNLLVEGLLIRWLTEASQTDQSAVIQRLALAIEKLLPAE